MNPNRLDQLLNFLKQEPNDPFLLHAAAIEYIGRGEDVQASQYFEKLLNVDPEYIGAFYHYGHVLMRLGDEEEAKTQFRRGIEVARKAGDHKTAGEIQTALDELEMD